MSDICFMFAENLKQVDMNQVKRILIITTTLIIFILLLSCEPSLCEDCYNVTSNGQTTYVCVEYNCNSRPNVQ